MYLVVLSDRAERFYNSASAELTARLDRCIPLLAVDPRRHPNIKALKGHLAGYFRFRVGDYRVVYRIEDAAQRVIVLKIAHRKEVY